MTGVELDAQRLQWGQGIVERILIIYQAYEVYSPLGGGGLRRLEMRAFFFKALVESTGVQRSHSPRDGFFQGSVTARPKGVFPHGGGGGNYKLETRKQKLEIGKAKRKQIPRCARNDRRGLRWDQKWPVRFWMGCSGNGRTRTSNRFVVARSERPYLVVAAQQSCGVSTITIVSNMNNPCAGVGATGRNGVHSLRNASCAPLGELHDLWLRLELRGHY